MPEIRAVVFDIGGVIQDSPLHAIARYERDHGLPPGTINRTVVAAGERGAWSRLERGELSVEPPQAAFLDDIGTNLKSAKALGMHTIKVSEPEQALRELGALVGFDLLG